MDTRKLGRGCGRNFSTCQKKKEGCCKRKKRGAAVFDRSHSTLESANVVIFLGKLVSYVASSRHGKGKEVHTSEK